MTQNLRGAATDFGKNNERFFVLGVVKANDALKRQPEHLDNTLRSGRYDPPFSETAFAAPSNADFTRNGFKRAHRQSSAPVRKIDRSALQPAGLPNHGSRALLHMLARLAAWKSKSFASLVANLQNPDNIDVLTTTQP